MYTKCFAAFALFVGLLSCGGKKEDPVAVQKRKTEENLRENLKKLDSLKSMVRDGDMVTRTGNSWDSEQIKDFQQKDKTFTHAGIARITDSGIMILHVMAKDSIYKTDYTLVEKIDSFLNPKLYTAYGIFRFSLDSLQTREMIQYMMNCYTRKVKFDYFFENRTDSAMYCSEMISKAVTKALDGKIAFTSTPITERRHVNMIKQYYRRYRPKDSDIVGRPIIAIDDLTTNPVCKNIIRFFLLK